VPVRQYKGSLQNVHGKKMNMCSNHVKTVALFEIYKIFVIVYSVPEGHLIQLLTAVACSVLSGRNISVL
jgi:hypothetical protein